MLVLSNSAVQTITANANATFNTILLKTGSGCECNNRGINRLPHVSAGIWEIEFHGNMAAAAANTALTVALAVDGIVLPETTMTITSTAAGDVYNVNASTLVKINGCKCNSSTVTLVNTGAATVTLAANPALILKRVG